LLLPRSLAHIVAVYNLLSNFKCSAVEWSMQIIGCISFKVRVISLSIRCRNECQGHKEIRHGNPNGHKSLPMSISDVLAMSDKCYLKWVPWNSARNLSGKFSNHRNLEGKSKQYKNTCKQIWGVLIPIFLTPSWFVLSKKGAPLQANLSGFIGVINMIITRLSEVMSYSDFMESS